MQVLTAILALATTALAAPVIEERAATTCGSTSYTATEVNQAAQKACSLYQGDSTADDYPHTYNNYEGFTFVVDGPYLEFPLQPGSVYTGGSPGADRVVINTSCKLAGEITHTGASGNDFVGCSGTN
ncbi:Ribonuclease/ribotoxin [Xylaria intraflava]|nr:Ribonuclease/ribotoxin [Xylaria intraflava]